MRLRLAVVGLLLLILTLALPITASAHRSGAGHCGGPVTVVTSLTFAAPGSASGGYSVYAGDEVIETGYTQLVGAFTPYLRGGGPFVTGESTVAQVFYRPGGTFSSNMATVVTFSSATAFVEQGTWWPTAGGAGGYYAVTGDLAFGTATQYFDGAIAFC
jgi:hypothetical protein